MRVVTLGRCYLLACDFLILGQRSNLFKLSLGLCLIGEEAPKLMGKNVKCELLSDVKRQEWETSQSLQIEGIDGAVNALI
ncbi:hypothetical protein Zmor_015267 [Zophobas morio]|uniref:Uncharacterized protein n=1 Tax=Zophobas morio TaxID=2755281 RepID=A0AA38IHQ5_9CUCU|nr:hypothetical protein Zmor_015267 [Zophobas morio]